MPIVCGIKFRGTGKVYYFAPGDLQSLQVGDHVIVETARGREMGQVAVEIREVDEAEIVGQLKPIVRRAGTADLLDAQRYQRQEDEAVAKCREQVARFDLPMKMVSAEYSYDGSRLTFFFTSDQRVDFRELVRELARIFRVRIELRQIGVRDEARIVGGIGKLRGTIIAALGLGLLNAFSEYYSSASLGKAIVFVCVIIFLQFRPNGIVTFRTRGLTT